MCTWVLCQSFIFLRHSLTKLQALSFSAIPLSLPPLAPQCWGYRCTTIPGFLQGCLRSKPGSSYMCNKHLPTELLASQNEHGPQSIILYLGIVSNLLLGIWNHMYIGKNTYVNIEMYGIKFLPSPPCVCTDTVSSGLTKLNTMGYVFSDSLEIN